MKAFMVFIGIIAVFAAILVVSLNVEKCNAIRDYNGGFHRECGGKWDLYSAAHVWNSGTVYYYKCRKCGGKFSTRFADLMDGKK